MIENPPAFPLATTADTIDYFGMTLRDWFAGQALAGLLTLPDWLNPSDPARSAYRIADAMLAERSKP